MAVKTSADIQIENKSYTNKDFSQLYPELLDLVKKLTNKWDPETTNESDPGLVLLKLLAFIADKNNYNIDKNILEQFMPSVTQEENMRKLCDMMGYNVKYYRSATTEISFTYLGGNATLDAILGIESENTDTTQRVGSTGVFHIKAFDTSFKTEDNIVYTLLEDIEITKDIRTSSKNAIQGQIKALNLNQGSTTSSEATKIQLYNLDENNRIYIPDIMVAENGIFINREIYNEIYNEDAWRKVDNLNDQELGSKVFKFGFDSNKNLPYIEFPNDIADLIEDGLEIYYIVSDGVEGNVSPNTITSFNTYSFDVTGVTEVEDSCYSLNNITSVSASEPETIDEAYKNFRKTIGTFNTLVSCKDYSNYIYTYRDESTNNYLVSNVQALDLRTDPNKSLSVLHRDENGITYYENVLKDKVKYTSINDIILHGTKPYNYEISNASAYEVTYNLLTNSDVKEGGEEDIDSILSNVKTISHILTTPSNDEIALIEERYTLHINISTKYKVNSTEQASILTNVRKALYNNFNARQLEFGEEIPYDEIISVIENADERIKLVVVDDPEINPYIIKATSSSKSQHAFDIDDNEQDRQIIVENILGGRIQLYIKDESLLFDYNMDFSNLAQYKHLAAIKTDLNLTIPQKQDNVSGYPLKKNESIQIIEDSYISTVTYPAYVYYGYEAEDGGQIKTEKGVPYKLKKNEILYIYYTDSNDVKKIETYKQGTIIRTNEFALPIGENTAPSRWYDKQSGEIKTDNNTDKSEYINLYALGTNETIEILKLNETVLDNFQQRCFWYTRPIIGTNDIINQKENDLIFYRDESADSGETYYHILEENEMFVYPSEDNFALFSVGSGTKLQVVLTNGIKNPFIDGKDKYGVGTIYIKAKETENKIDLTQLQEAINTQDISNFENSYDWTSVNFRTYPLHIVETSITTYIEGDEIQVDGNPLSLTSQWSNGTKLSLITTAGKKSTGDITNAKIRAILSFTGNSVNPQVLDDNQNITLYYYKDGFIDDEGYYDETIVGDEPKYTSVSLTKDQNIQVNAIIDDYNDIILRTMYYEEDKDSLELKFNGRYEVPYSAIVYGIQEATEGTLYGLITNEKKSKSASRSEYSFKWSEFYKLLENNKLTIDAPKSIDNIYINIFNQYNAETILKKVEGGKWEFDFTGKIPEEGNKRESYNIFISTPILLNLNPLLETQIKPDTLTKILGKIEQRTDFDYLADLSNSKLIDSYDLINSFFDYNNIYNPLTIAKIDFSSDVFKCNIVASSRK